MASSTAAQDVHPGWTSLTWSLQQVGLLSDWTLSTLSMQLRGHGHVAPDPTMFVATLTRYYEGEGNPLRGARRAKREQVLVLRPGNVSSTASFLARLGWIAPRLRGVSLRSYENQLWLQTEEHRVAIEGAERLPDGRQVVPIHSTVRTANALLALMDADQRVVPLLTILGVHVFCMLDLEGAHALSNCGVLNMPLDATCAFAGWGSPAGRFPLSRITSSDPDESAVRAAPKPETRASRRAQVWHRPLGDDED